MISSWSQISFGKNKFGAVLILSSKYVKSGADLKNQYSRTCTRHKCGFLWTPQDKIDLNQDLLQLQPQKDNFPLVFQPTKKHKIFLTFWKFSWRFLLQFENSSQLQALQQLSMKIWARSQARTTRSSTSTMSSSFRHCCRVWRHLSPWANLGQ